ncbi:MAG: 30S ribosomal protein S1 [Gammaproteobacteria bacterium]|nr:30S ribosomal protein S1 [Gammaproteobacteria bacterium]
MAESFAELLEESLGDSWVQPGSLIKARVVSVGSDYVLVNAGLKSESAIPTEQFKREDGEINVVEGDEVEVAVEAIEDGFGETRLSREKARRLRSWEVLKVAFESEDNVTGYISGKVKGGFSVDLDGIRAFLPGSLVDVRPVRDPSYLEGKPLDFKLIKLDQRRNNVVVSRRAVVEKEYSAEREALLDRLTEGALLQGVVKNMTEYGAFVDLGGIDGLLHVTDMAWRRVRSPEDVVEVGQEIEVKVLKFDRERNRVSLGLKQLTEDPWLDLPRRYPPATRIFGQVTNITDYGCFVEIEDGVEGLVHSSEMDWANKTVNPSRFVHIGQEVEVMVLAIDPERRRISLGMKQCTPNPWEDFSANHEKGERITGSIKSITDFGLFIGLEGGVDGLIHISDLAWDDAEEDILRKYKKGEEVEAVLLSVDTERERISLGIKQLERDPFSSYLAEHPKGSTVTGPVEEVTARGALVTLDQGVTGYLRASDISRERVEDVRQVLKVGEEVSARIVGVDRKSRQLTLSIKARQIKEDAEALEEYGKAGGSSATTTLGDMLKNHLGRG